MGQYKDKYNLQQPRISGKRKKYLCASLCVFARTETL